VSDNPSAWSHRWADPTSTVGMLQRGERGG
jgi:hypothetical protein